MDELNDEMEEFDILYYEENYKDGCCRYERDGFTIIMSENENTYTMQIESPYPDMVCTMKFFYADSLKLMTVGHYLKKGGCRIGIWTTYDNTGEVLEETDYEEGWEVSWELLLPVLISEKYDFKSIVGIGRCVLNDEKDETEVEQTNEEEKESNVEKEKNDAPKTDAPDENIEVENGWMDEEELMEFEKEIMAENGSFDEEEVVSKPQPVKCWIITQLLSPKVMVDHYYSGDTGEKIGDNYRFLK